MKRNLLLSLGAVAAAALMPVSVTAASPEAPVDSIGDTVLFKVAKYYLTPYTRSQLDRLCADALELSGDSVSGVTVVGSSSPEGRAAYNRTLSHDRARAVAGYVARTLNRPSVPVSTRGMGEDWDGLRHLVEGDPDVPSKERVLEIICSDAEADVKERRLRSLAGGKPWSYIFTNLFPLLRYAQVTISYPGERVVTQTVYEEEIVAEEVVEPVVEPVEEVVEVVETPVVADDLWTRHAYIKTNIPAWAMLWVNAAGEIDIAPHWSANLSVYYSGFNYFTRTEKFRTFAVMPEVRYWFRADNQGFFVAPHFGLGWYNVAFDGDHRYQDHDGDTPAIGGGVNVGFRFNLSRNRRWKMEASLGFGVYRLDYDLFENRTNGLLLGRKKRTFYGVDNAALSICYMFDVNGKKGGRR